MASLCNSLSFLCIVQGNLFAAVPGHRKNSCVLRPSFRQKLCAYENKKIHGSFDGTFMLSNVGQSYRSENKVEADIKTAPITIGNRNFFNVI